MASSVAYDNTNSDYDKYGFDCTFVQEPPSKFICPICAMILRDPYQTQCCGCHYCQCCVQQLVHNTTPCVTCSGVVRAFRDVSVTQKINALQVKCSNADWGCVWSGELGQVGEHMVTCRFKPTKCSSCGLFVPKEISREHESQHCPKRTYTCTYCSKFTSAYDVVKSTHWPQCPCFPIECPNKCSKKVPREKILKHLKENCARIREMAETIELLELALEQKEVRIEELETEIGSGDKTTSDKVVKKSKTIGLFKRKGSKAFDEIGKEAVEELSHSNKTEDPRGFVDSGGKERNYEQEVKLLKECIAEKVAEIEELRLRNLEQCTTMAQMEEDFAAQLKAVKIMCRKLSDEKEALERRISEHSNRNSSGSDFSQLI